ncbi:hypothetical protein ANCCEY_00918 [Ancylostoma ceylanicum]|uniref:PABS domain-containing protein n=1 Tax=Ancylostoma ceylanicum TaxID=53326 RepID=A0A0D6M744_9BILA|nr:hypothetical protein ANCCEY_00918 [Ancylostoma ceylanicum]
MDRTCFLIIDRVGEVSGRILAFRKLKRKGPQGVLTLSDTRIQPPSTLTWENFNTKTWKIRKDTVRLIYARTMIVGAFMCGALEFNTKRKQDVLIIGLGGGVINNYLTSMKNQKLNVTVVDIDPVMKKIAEKWFGFQETPLHRIIIEDGVNYFLDAAKRGEKYDIVLLDVSCNVIRDLMGPTEDFLKDDVIESIRAILADTGAVVVNIVTKPETKDEAEKMLFCSAMEKNSWNDKREELYARYVAVDKALGFQLSVKDQCTNYPSD